MRTYARAPTHVCIKTLAMDESAEHSKTFYIAFDWGETFAAMKASREYGVEEAHIVLSEDTEGMYRQGEAICSDYRRMLYRDL